jgi:hypothetical protein
MMRLERNTWLNVFIVFLATVGGSVVGFWFVLTFGPISPFPTLHAKTAETAGAAITSTDPPSWISK